MQTWNEDDGDLVRARSCVRNQSGWSGNPVYLGQHRFPVVRDHRALFAVQRHGRLLERFLVVPHMEVQFGDAALEYAAEVARYQRPSYCCSNENHTLLSVTIAKPRVHAIDCIVCNLL